MTPDQQARAHDANFAGTFRTMCGVIAGAWAEDVAGVPVAVTGLPVAFFNAAWSAEDTQESALQAAIGRLGETGLPYVVHVPAGAEALGGVAAALGLELQGQLPCFAIEPGPMPDPPAELRIERVDRANIDAFRVATVSGYGMAAPLVDQFYPDALVDLPQIRAFVGWSNGRPVAASLASRTHDTVGIYSVATVPESRRRGIGAAMTWHLLRDADPGWRLGVLQASEMGRPLYERMGFRLVREFDEYTRPANG
jgi:ribosomal protein S18 acetylase RimI-like enzyme